MVKDSALDFTAVLDRMQALLGETVNVAVSSADRTSTGHVLQVAGILASGWPTPEATRAAHAAGIEQMIPFHFEDQPATGILLNERDFVSARESNGVLRIIVGAIEMVLFRTESPREQSA